MIQCIPTAESFSVLYDQGIPSLVWFPLAADLETPISASIKLQQKGEPFFLLESVTGGTTKERYSIIGLRPDIMWKFNDTKVEISHDGMNFVQDGNDPIGSFRKLWEASKLDIPKELPPMASGIIGYMSYDAIRLIEPSVPDENPDTINIPTGQFMRPRVMVIFDAVTTIAYLIASVFPKPGVSATQAYQDAVKNIHDIMDSLQTKECIGQARLIDKTNVGKHIEFTSNMTRDEYHQMVEKAKEYILAGDIFQVVPSQRFKAPFVLPPFALYRSLRHLNPSPFLFYLDFVSFQLVGSSPEILVRLRDNKVTIRPLAGTRKRGANSEEDKRLSEELLHDEKEIAEHLMLVDLSRNDIGKVTIPGSVEVSEFMEIEYYSHVMHISSNVEGQLAEGFDALDALFAGLPVGTVSGAPKIRAMQIIDCLEKEKRSFYAGCVGYFSANGTMDTCITLRTALVKDEMVYVQSGGGVVADSDPEAEYQETCNKAKALIQAAEDAILYKGLSK